jgi:hypothetical protein
MRSYKACTTLPGPSVLLDVHVHRSSVVSSTPDLRFPSCLPCSSPRRVLHIARGDELGKLMQLDLSDSFPGVDDGLLPSDGQI